jgi:lysophospholipid acyltransferase
MLSAYPLGYLHYKTPMSATLKHLTGGLLGVFFIIFCMGSQVIHSVVSASVAYILLMVVPAEKVPSVMLIFTMGYMSGAHIYRMYVDYLGWHLDFTGPQMVLTMKLHSFAYNYSDGVKRKRGAKLKLYPEQNERAVETLPSIVEYFGFVYYFGGILAGPNFEIKEYLACMDGTLFKADKNGKMPDPLWASIWHFIMVLPLGVGMQLAAVYPASYLVTPAFLNAPIPERIWIAYITSFFKRCGYYFGWKLAEGGCIAGGLGFNGYDRSGAARWDGTCNILISKIELADNPKMITDNWNMNTAVWLKRYIYFRFREGKKPGQMNTIVTFLTSAFWHGFYPGYYIAFFMGAVAVNAARNSRRLIRPYFLTASGAGNYPLKWAYDIVGKLMAAVMLNQVLMPFALLTLTDSLTFWHSCYWILHVGCLVLLFVVPVVIPAKKDKASRQKSE